MEREMSSGAMLGIVLLAGASTVGLGIGVFAIAKGVASEDGKSLAPVINNFNTPLLVVTAIILWLAFLTAFRLTYLYSNYFDSRFKFAKSSGEKLTLNYIANRRVNVYHLFILLFKTMRYKQVEVLDIDNSNALTLNGTLVVLNDMLTIDGYYLSFDTSLFEFIDTNVTLNLSVAGKKQILERYIRDYSVVGVNVLI